MDLLQCICLKGINIVQITPNISDSLDRVINSTMITLVGLVRRRDYQTIIVQKYSDSDNLCNIDVFSYNYNIII